LHLVRTSSNLGHCPKHFRKSTTVGLRKPDEETTQRTKYTGLIALFNTVGKIVDTTIAQRLSYPAETYGLLPDSHMRE
ncbi:hypothetical protein BDP81DRAFT_494711, partial [Colletotrichum phormii]